MFNTSFYHFFFGFLVIIGVAFSILIITGAHAEPNPIDNVAQPQ